MFAIDITDGKSAIADAGEVVFDISSDVSECIMVDESALDADGNCAYGPDDPRILGYAMANEVKSKSDLMADFENVTFSAALADLASNEVHVMGPESSVIRQTVVAQTSDMDIDDVQKLFRIYVNYKKDMYDGSAITLFFNYQNYLNSPFIRVGDGGRLYQDTIEGTYLRLGPGESGNLDLIVQFRYNVGGHAVSVSNVRMFTYQVFNISDDKPKFVIRQIYRVGNDAYRQYDMTMQMSRQTIEFPNDEQKTKFTMSVTWNCVTDIKTIDFDVVYNGDLFKCLGSDQNYVKVSTDDSPSIAQVHVENPTGSAVSLNFECNFSNR